VQAPLRDDDPTDPRVVIVAPDDPRITALIKRGRLLPPDLQAAVAAEGISKGVPKLDGPRRITEAHLATIEPIMASAEAEYMPRAKRINEAFELAEAYGISEAAIRARRQPGSRPQGGP
jgi:hypothetical protein